METKNTKQRRSADIQYEDINYEDDRTVDVPMRLVYLEDKSNKVTGEESNSDVHQSLTPELTNKLTQIQQYQDKLTKLNNDLNNLMTRIAGVSDDVLKEQLSEDFVNLDNQISMTKVNIEDTTNQYTNLLFECYATEYKSFYINQFVNADIITCLEKTNSVEIKSSVIKMRLRPPASLKQKREICLIADAFNVTIHLVDYEGIYLDYIGKGSVIWNLYCNIFSKFGDVVGINTVVVCQKAVL